MTPECRHIKTSGGKCGSPALRGQPYCYFHSRIRQRATQQPCFLPDQFSNLEDRGAIQSAIGEVAKALADHRIDTKRASILLYALQIASGNAKDSEQIVSSEAIEETVRNEGGEEMALEGAIAGPPPEESILIQFDRYVRSLPGNEHLSSDPSAYAAANKNLREKSQGEGEWWRRPTPEIPEEPMAEVESL